MSVIKLRDIPEDTPLDRIYKAFVAHKLDALSESDKEIHQRITEIDRQITARKPVKKNIRGKKVKYRTLYSSKELCEWVVERFGVSHRQAYIDIDMCKRFYLSTETREDKEYARGQRIAIGNELMFEAAAQGDYKSAAAFYKEINEITGLKRTDPETLNPEMLIPSDPIIVDDPSEIGFEPIENLAALTRELEKEFKRKTIDNVINSAEETDYESDPSAE
jgi:hypothetical protein